MSGKKELRKVFRDQVRWQHSVGGLERVTESQLLGNKEEIEGVCHQEMRSACRRLEAFKEAVLQMLRTIDGTRGKHVDRRTNDRWQSRRTEELKRTERNKISSCATAKLP